VIPLSLISSEGGRAFVGMVARDAYDRWLASEVLAILEGGFRELTDDLRRIGPNVRDKGRQALLWRQIATRLQRAYGDADQFTDKQNMERAELEWLAARAEVAMRVTAAGAVMPESSMAMLSTNLVQSIARLPVEGLPLGDWWTAQAASMTVETRRAIQIGMVQGEGVDDLVKRIIPPKDATAPAVWRKASAQAETIVRTATNATYNAAAMAGYESAGPDVSGEYELITARDNRVSRICAALDGNRYRYDDPDRKVPPFHMRCRTTMVPVINYGTLGLPAPGARSPMTYQSFAGWFTNQSKSAHNEILGPTRAEWFREGRLPLRELVDGDTRERTLDQLREVLLPAA
jgi:SPP1 gp7 family putative phage head morphogenesis protein